MDVSCIYSLTYTDVWKQNELAYFPSSSIPRARTVQHLKDLWNDDFLQRQRVATFIPIVAEIFFLLGTCWLN